MLQILQKLHEKHVPYHIHEKNELCKNKYIKINIL